MYSKLASSALRLAPRAVAAAALAGGVAASRTADCDDCFQKGFDLATTLGSLSSAERKLVSASLAKMEAAEMTPTMKIVQDLISTYGKTTGTKFHQGGDIKDTEDFVYLTFDECPKFTDKHRSAMSKFVTPELWAKLKDKKTSKGYTLSNAVQTGCLIPHLGVGCTAGDEESWEVFKDLYYPVIDAWHSYDANTQTHPTDLDPSKLVFSDAQKAKFNKYVASTRIRAARNVSGFALPCGATDSERAGVEKVLKAAFAGLEGNLKGTYYDLGNMTDKQRDFLLNKGYLFQIPSARNLLMGAGAARSWPNNRGIFHNDNQTALAWCNEEDHCRIISMDMGGDIPAVFSTFCQLSEALQASATKNGTKLMWTPNLGFLGTCPSNLGTGLRASVMVQLKCFNAILEDPNSSHEDKELLEQVCDAFDLQPRGSAGEHSPAKNAKFDVSNKQRLGYSEVQLVQKMIDGVTKVIELEEALAAGATAAEIRAKVQAMK
jgi:creatine kinase